MWAARDKNGALTLFMDKPVRIDEFWCQDDDASWTTFDLDPKLFPNLKWDDGPVEVELTEKKCQREGASAADGEDGGAGRKSVWVARDKDWSLFAYNDRPWRQVVDGMWIDNVGVYVDWKDETMYIERLPDDMYPGLAWEDEPVEVEQVQGEGAGAEFELAPGKPCRFCSHRHCLGNGGKCVY